MDAHSAKEILQISVCVVACCTNSALACLTLRQHTRVGRRVSIGNYRFLLLAFACSNIVFSLNHVVIRPVVYFSGNGWIYFTELAPRLPYYGGIISCSIFILMFYQTFILLSLHFVYRWNAICQPSYLQWISKWHVWKAALLLGILALGYNLLFNVFILACCCPTTYSDDLLTRLHMYELFDLDPRQHSYFAVMVLMPNGKGGFDWNFAHVLATIGWSTLVLGTGALIIFCIIRIRRAFKTIAMSNRTHELHRQLFIALLIQTLIPTIFSYVPMMLIFLSPVTGVDLSYGGSLLVRITIVFPITDPILVISFVKCLREQVLMLPIFKFCKSEKESAVVPLDPSFTTVVKNYANNTTPGASINASMSVAATRSS